jgi:serine/threonine protein kinase
LPMYQWYFLPVINECKINIRNLKSPDIMACDVITNATKTNTRGYIAMDIPYMDGIDFIELIERSEAGEVVLILSEAYRHLLNAIEKLVEVKVIHFDIKLENVLFSKINGQPRLIDFGISIPVENLNKKTYRKYFYAYVPEYYVWAPLVHLINYCLHMASGPLTEKDIEKVSYDCIVGNKALDIFSPEFVDNYRRTLGDYMSKFVGKELEIAIEEMLEYKYTWDIYSLGVMYLNILAALFPNAANGNPFVVMFSQVLLKTIHPNPTRRLNAASARNEFDNIFFIEGDVSNYLELASTFDIHRQIATHKIKNSGIPNAPMEKK